MRLWHQNLIPKLSRQHLLAQHRELCALRGKGWQRKHATVDYVFKYSIFRLFSFHVLVMNEMQNRGFKVDENWLNFEYRGKILGIDTNIKQENIEKKLIYEEHDADYLAECLENLRKKGF